MGIPREFQRLSKVPRGDLGCFMGLYYWVSCAFHMVSRDFRNFPVVIPVGFMDIPGIFKGVQGRSREFHGCSIGFYRRSMGF